MSRGGHEIVANLKRAPTRREPVGHDRSFLDDYRPNETHYLTAQDRKRLREIGSPAIAEQPAGTYARQILDRLLIDLSWSSSRLEGNTYSLLDTRRLLAFSHQAEGKAAEEAQMSLNHKGAIEFLVDAASEVGFDRLSVFNLHALLAHNLLPDPASPGRLRFRDEIREVVASIVCGPLGRRAALAQIGSHAATHIEEGHREHFREVVETEVLALHEGNFARYRIRPCRVHALVGRLERAGPVAVEGGGWGRGVRGDEGREEGATIRAGRPCGTGAGRGSSPRR